MGAAHEICEARAGGGGHVERLVVDGFGQAIVKPVRLHNQISLQIAVLVIRKCIGN